MLHIFEIVAAAIAYIGLWAGIVAYSRREGEAFKSIPNHY